MTSTQYNIYSIKNILKKTKIGSEVMVTLEEYAGDGKEFIKLAEKMGLKLIRPGENFTMKRVK